MFVMGIECSAHTFGVGIVKDGKIIANSKIMYPITDKGIIPIKVSEFHVKNSSKVIKDALLKANVSLDDLDAIGYTRGPGLGPCLRVGQLSAITLSEILKIPIYPINHGVAHIEITRTLNNLKDPLALYVSGGNSQILVLEEEPFRHYHILGETFDIGIGNMFDSFARAAALKPAWGSTLAKLAETGKYIPMPYNVKGMDFTFTGIMTNALKMVGKEKIEDIAFSIQETSFTMLCETTERALLLTKKKELILCGGVAQSSRLKYMLTKMAKAHGVKVYVAENQFNSDNGAMIAITAEKVHKNASINKNFDLSVEQRYRIDAFEILW